MTRLKNEQGINKIIMKPVAYTKCEIGQDWYRNELLIVFEPDGYYPDYMEVNEWVMAEIDGKEYNIEDVVNKIYNFLKTEYKPNGLKVRDNIINCKTHFDVIVEK